MGCNYIYKENETRSAGNWLPVPVWSPSAVQLKPFQAQVRDLLPLGAQDTVVGGLASPAQFGLFPYS